MRRVIPLLPMLLVLTACTTGAGKQTGESLRVQCDPPRPQVCTMEYAPVCATLKGGEQRDYSSGCNACADDNVASWAPGKCEQQASGEDRSD